MQAPQRVEEQAPAKPVEPRRPPVLPPVEEDTSSWFRVFVILVLLIGLLIAGGWFTRGYFVAPSLSSLIVEHRALADEAEQVILLPPNEAQMQLTKIGRKTAKLKSQIARLPSGGDDDVQARRSALSEANNYLTAACRVPAEQLAGTINDKNSSNPLVLADQKLEFAAKGTTGREAAGEVLDLSEATFDKTVLASGDLFIVDFWAPWCGPCKMFSPIIEDVAHDYGDRLRVAKVNTDDNPVLMQRYGANAIPLMVIFKGGKEVGRTVGALPKEAVVQEISKYM